MHRVQKITLENGLTLLLAVDHRHAVTAMHLWVQVGSADESPTLNGISHCIEHMLFKGTKRYTNNALSSDVERAGGTLNAFTSLDYTGYHMSLPSAHADLGVNILADMVQNPLLRSADLRNEARVILEEMGEEQDSPEMLLGHRLFELCYPGDPYGRAVIGNRRTVSRFKSNDVRAYFRRHYRPERMVLAIAGAFDADAMQALVRKLFRADAEPLPRILPELKRASGLRHSWVRKGNEQSAVEMAFHTPGMQHAHTTPLDLLAFILAGGEHSRLYQRLIDKQKLARAIDTHNFAPQRGGMLITRAVLADNDFPGTIRAVVEEMRRIADEGVGDDELELAKSAIESDLIFEGETAEGVAHNLAFYETSLGDYGWEASYLRMLRACAAEDLRRLARLYLHPDNLCIVGLSPEGANLPLKPAEIPKLLQNNFSAPRAARNRRRQISSKTAVQMHSPAPGLDLIYGENRSSRVATLYLSIPGGVLHETKDNVGIGNLGMSLLSAGTKQRGETELSRRLAQLGAEFDASLGRSHVGMRLDLPAPRLDEGLDLFLEIVNQPAFQDKALKRERAFLLRELRSLKDQYELDAFDMLLRHLFPKHPYGFNAMGTAKSLRSFTVDSVAEHYHRRILAAPWRFVVVSPQPGADIQAKLLQQPSVWRPQSPNLPAPEAAPDKQLVYREIPGSKAYLYWGFRTPPVASDRWAALETLTGVLTGFGAGRLYQKLREQFGLAYTVQSFAYHGSRGGYFAIYVNSAPKNFGKIDETIRAELKRLREEPIEDDELQRAKNYLVGSYAVDMQKSSAQAAQLAMGKNLGLGCDLTLYGKRIMKLRSRDLQKLAAQHLNDNQAVISLLSPEPPPA